MTGVPERITVGDNGRLLRLAMGDGTTHEIAALRLRAACNCAACRRARLDGRFRDPGPEVTIVEAEAVGQYAVALGFSDRHARGIYPWRYLLELAAGAAAPP
jgi:DUF971 family protein